MVPYMKFLLKKIHYTQFDCMMVEADDKNDVCVRPWTPVESVVTPAESFREYVDFVRLQKRRTALGVDVLSKDFKRLHNKMIAGSVRVSLDRKYEQGATYARRKNKTES